MKNKIIRNITLSAVLIDLAIIFEKLLVIQIPPFIRIGIGSIPVILSSVVLGPIYGAVIGVSADVLGFFFFDTSGFGYSIFPTISFFLMGVLPHFLFKFSCWMRYKKRPFPITYILLGLVWIFILVYVLLFDSVRVTGVVVPLDLTMKITLPIVSGLVFAGFSWFVHYLNRHFQRKILTFPVCPSPHEVAFVILVLELLIHIVWGSIWKGIFFEVDPLMVFFVQSVILTVSFPIKTFVLTYVLTSYHRYIDKERTQHHE